MKHPSLEADEKVVLNRRRQDAGFHSGKRRHRHPPIVPDFHWLDNMSSPTTTLLREWKRLSNAESTAITLRDWSELNRLLDEKSRLQGLLDDYPGEAYSEEDRTLVGELINTTKAGATIWVSNPTWANHAGVFTAAGLQVKSYPYYDYDNKCLDFDGMMEALKKVPADDAVLIHACCHNPSGMDLSQEQWQQVAALARDVGFFPVIDMAYQGFGEGLEEDAWGLRLMADTVEEMILCSSCSKNFGLYRERIGACSVIGKSAAAADIIHSVLLPTVRVNYSMPPAHGAAIVETVLGSEELTAQWQGELAQMRDRINGMRQLLVDKLVEHGVTRDFSFITAQNGMFSFLGISPEQVQRLQEEFAIYIVGSSRISIAAIAPDNVDYLAQSIAEVL